MLVLVKVVLLKYRSAGRGVRFSGEIVYDSDVSQRLIILGSAFLFSCPLRVRYVSSVLLMLSGIGGGFFRLFALGNMPVGSFKRGKRNPTSFVGIRSFGLSRSERAVCTCSASLHGVIGCSISSFLGSSLGSRIVRIGCSDLPRTRIPAVVCSVLSLGSSGFLMGTGRGNLQFKLLGSKGIARLCGSFSSYMGAGSSRRI